MGVRKRMDATVKCSNADVSAKSTKVRPAGTSEMRLIALQAMLNQLVSRDDILTKLESIIMAGVAGKSHPRS